MNKYILIIISLFMLSACGSDDSGDLAPDTGFDIECQNKENGWNEVHETIVQENGAIYEVAGSWFCRDNYLWMSNESLEYSPFGEFTVTKTATQDNTTSDYRYTIMQTTEALQNLVIQAIDSNGMVTGDVKSLHKDLSFETEQGIMPQLLSMNTYTNSNYAVLFEPNSALLTHLDKTVIRSVSKDNIYTIGVSQCSVNSWVWTCQNSQLKVDQQQNIIETTPQAPHTVTKTLEPNVTELNNPTTANTEILRLARKLNL